MAKLIDSGELLAQIDKYMAMMLYGCTFRGGQITPMMLEMRQAVLCDVKQLIYSAPTIDAAPVRRGEWKNESTFIDDVRGPRFVEIARCNLCGGAGAYTNFCPNCGADMRGVCE